MSAKPCPLCGRTLDLLPPTPKDPTPQSAHFPFCSERCRNVDLGRWLTGRYTIAGEALPDHTDDGGE